MQQSKKYRYKIHDKLYDLTDFVKIHPGGQDMFKNLKPDINITPLLYSYHKNPQTILAMLPKYEVPLPSDCIIKYDTNYTYDSYCELKKLVFAEIQYKKIPLYWNNLEIAYNAFMLSLYSGTWLYCLWNAANLSYWWVTLLAFMNNGICNLIFHEASHYCGFKNQTINHWLTVCNYPLMGESFWKYNHNYLHHCFTNTKYDIDFSFPNAIVRHSPTQKYNWYNKYQSFYIFLLFQITCFHKGLFVSLKRSGLYNWVFFPLLIFVLGLYKTLFWYALSGLIFTFIAQLSHIQDECVKPDLAKKNDFLYNQVASSMNYCTNDLLTRCFCFGLDIQIEHHLFPNVPHSSLRQIKPIVRDYCEKNAIPYLENPSILSSIYSYIRHLCKMGNP